MDVSKLPPETVFYLEMTSPDQLVPSRRDGLEAEVRRQAPPDPQLNRRMYEAVGKDWYWIDRLPWTDKDWSEYAHHPDLETWTLHVAGEIAGYFELRSDSGGSVEIMQFGLLPDFIGQGLGGHLLTLAIERAWEMGGSRVWLHTSSRDHPNALSNYQARGFRLFKKETLLPYE